MVDDVKVLDDDASSSFSGYVPRRRRNGRVPIWKSPRRQELPQVDGKVPPVIHTLEYVDRRDRVITFRQSAHPFKDATSLGFQNEGDVDTDADDKSTDSEKNEGPLEQPVLEIVTTVCSLRHRPGPSHHNIPRVPKTCSKRPITAAFNQDDSCSSDNSDGDRGPFFAAITGVSNDPVMLIHSENLKNALRATVAHYIDFRMTEKPLEVWSDYRILYHHREELARYRNNQPASHTTEYAATTAEHIDVLLSFLETNDGGEIRKEEERHKLDVPTATHAYFWLLIKPGKVMYAKRYDIWTPYVIRSIAGGSSPGAPYTIHAWLLESNGTKVSRFNEVVTVLPWLGEQAISTLSVVPAAFWKEDLGAQCGIPMREKCIAEGRLYWELLKAPTYMDYDGLLVNSSTDGRQGGGPTGYMVSRVVVDPPGFEKYYHDGVEIAPRRRRCYDRSSARPPINYNRPPLKDHLPKTLPRCGCQACDENPTVKDSPFAGFEDLDPMKDTPPDSDLFYMLLSNTIPGFILGTRRWGHLNIQHLKPVETDKEAFKSLVIDEDIKLTIKVLVGQFATSIDGGVSPWGNDFVKNKGEGRIFLLHGEPGVGKTCTAECIAELTGRPLIALTSGDLDVNSFRVESNLNYFLELGQRYGALVLLDEADVYLERRRPKDISRNALVSIFLRALEYYRGVLLISTNRVQSFDPAFMSRIHVALHYKNLCDEDRELIWANHFDRLGRESGGKVHISVAAREYVWNSHDVRALQWNGREIRNAMQTALALAESEAADEGFERVTISEKHIRAVAKMSRGFKDFLGKSMPEDQQDYEADRDEP